MVGCAVRNAFNVELVAGRACAVVGFDGCSGGPSIAERDHVTRVERDEVDWVAGACVEDASEIEADDVMHRAMQDARVAVLSMTLYFRANRVNDAIFTIHAHKALPVSVVSSDGVRSQTRNGAPDGLHVRAVRMNSEPDVGSVDRRNGYSEPARE